MSYIYAMSDIHGELDIFENELKNVDLSNSNNKLILLGDYIDGGPKSCETLYFIKELYERYSNQIIVLRGNHEELFLEQFKNDKYNFTVDDYRQLRDYMSQEEFNDIKISCKDISSASEKAEIIYKKMNSLVKEKHKNLIKWLKTLPYYFETENNQIYVHAGIDEGAKEYWKWGNEDYYFVWKYPYVVGEFYKDIIAGHVHTSIIAQDDNYYNVYFDKQNHFYIDGNSNRNSFIPILKYNTSSGEYTAFDRVKETDGNLKWIEYIIK